MNHARTALLYLGLALVASVTAVPFLWIVLTSLKGAEDVFAFPPTLWPDVLQWSNYAETWNAVRPSFGRYLLNSVLVSVMAVGLNVFLASLAAYPLARMEFKGKKFAFLAIVATMMVPEQVIMIPLYTLVLKLGLVNTLAGVVIPFAVNAFGIFLMRQFYLGIPKELEDAAVVDGCTPLGVWWYVLVPLSRPAIATLAVFTFVGAWSNFLWPLVVLQDREVYTLPVALASLTGAFSANFRYVAAGAVIAVLPVLMVYLVAQRAFIRGLMAGGVKG